MPREQRKRGKKHKAKHENEIVHDVNKENIYEDDDEGPNDFGQATSTENYASEAPFGLLDPDVKAYFRTVNDQLKEWQDEGVSVEVDAVVDANEERRLFFKAALTEMSGKELALASDPECSPVLERMLYSMDDFARRVFTDCLAGSWIPLANNRFASHVCQTLLTLAVDTINREMKGIFPPSVDGDDQGELLTMTQLIVDACEDILNDLPNLVQNVFASHVLRSLLSLLAPSMLLSTQRLSKHAPNARSKKSASWKARQGPMKSIIQSHPEESVRKVTEAQSPIAFTKMAKKLLEKLREVTGPNEMRALAVDKVASPLMQLFLELEASMGESDTFNSIMDSVLVGLISNPESHNTPSSYVSSLILDATSSHITESIVSNCSTETFNRLWKHYFFHDLSRLSTHPVANYVLARAILRLDNDQFEDALSKLEGSWKRSLKLLRLGVLSAVIDRASQLGNYEGILIETICSTFEIPQDERSSFVPCLLRLKTPTEYKEALEHQRRMKEQKDDATGEQGRSGRRITDKEDSLEPKIQGSLLLQSILRMHAPHNEIVLQSLHFLPSADLLAIACNPTSSRILDVALETESIPLRLRKRLVTSFIGQFHLLVGDRIGSRVAERCWAAADPYLKEKIARSLIIHEQFLAGSHFGRFFTRNLGLPLLKRDPDQWKAARSKEHNLSTSANMTVPQKPGVSVSSQVPSQNAPIQKPEQLVKKRKRKETRDEIDELFDGVGAHKRARGLLSSNVDEVSSAVEKPNTIVGIETSVMNAIKLAGHDSGASHKKKKK